MTLRLCPRQGLIGVVFSDALCGVETGLVPIDFGSSSKWIRGQVDLQAI